MHRKQLHPLKLGKMPPLTVQGGSTIPVERVYVRIIVSERFAFHSDGCYEIGGWHVLAIKGRGRGVASAPCVQVRPQGQPVILDL